MPNWTILRTTKGAELYNKVLSGTAKGPLKITRSIACKTGGLTKTQMLSATISTLTSAGRYAQDLKVVDVLKEGMVASDANHSVIVTQLDNKNTTAEWNLCIIGICAKIDGEEEILFSIAQDSQPDKIPKYSETPIVSTYTFNLITGDVPLENASLDLSGLVTKELLNTTLEQYLHKQKGGVVSGNVVFGGEVKAVNGKIIAKNIEGYAGIGIKGNYIAITGTSTDVDGNTVIGNIDLTGNIVLKGGKVNVNNDLMTHKILPQADGVYVIGQGGAKYKEVNAKIGNFEEANVSGKVTVEKQIDIVNTFATSEGTLTIANWRIKEGSSSFNQAVLLWQPTEGNAVTLFEYKNTDGVVNIPIDLHIKGKDISTLINEKLGTALDGKADTGHTHTNFDSRLSIKGGITILDSDGNNQQDLTCENDAIKANKFSATNYGGEGVTSTPQKDSTKLLTSGGAYNELTNKVNTTDLVTVKTTDSTTGCNTKFVAVVES